MGNDADTPGGTEWLRSKMETSGHLYVYQGVKVY